MKVKFILIGKTSFKFVETGLEMYKERLKRLADFELSIIPDLKNTKNMPHELIKVKEGALIMKILTNADFVVLLDEKGRSLNSLKFASLIENKLLASTKQLVFIVGGAYGFSKEIYKRGDFLLSLSEMTFSHQIIRLFFMEQIYRAFTIIKGLPYHNE
ncbi:MAG: 23S rRNA (pseudouridine(1915)-N(3))-methyltransferase RlmH [Bacteroidota bacterium]